MFKRQKVYFLFNFLILQYFCVTQLFAQQSEFERWATLVNWDGVSTPESYIITSSGFLGPGALPVPYLRDGKISNKIIFENAVEYYQQPGEKTANTYHQLTLPFASGKIALTSYWRPLEHFEMNQSILDERKILPQKGKGYAGGDLYFGTIVQLLQEKNNWLPDANLGITFKTTTGKGLENARHINAPGYIFDVAADKTIYKNEKGFKIKAGTLLGFYAWQQKLNVQNDAFLFGLKSSVYYKSSSLIFSYSGYNGWIDNGDKPKIIRAEISQNFRQTNFYFLYQYGIQDMIKNGYRLGAKVSF